MNNQLKRRINLLEVRASVVAPAALPPRPPVRVPKDVVELLAEQVEAVRQDSSADPLDRARTLALVGSLALRAMEAAGGIARVEALERALAAMPRRPSLAQCCSIWRVVGFLFCLTNAKMPSSVVVLMRLGSES